MTDDPREDALMALRRAQEAGLLPEVVKAIRAFLTEQGQESLWGGVSREKTEKGPGKFGIIGKSPPMQAVFERIGKLLPSKFPVLIHGESGTGKELVARALHQFGPRKEEAFLSQNCAAIPEPLLEAELFGHVKGSFTGAVADRPGHFRAADGGTLFLDEIGDMSPSMQTKLLRVLEDGEVRPVGSTKVYHVDVRVIAASNKRLPDLVSGGEFREDLFYRLNVLGVELPPLRDRPGDIPLLVEHFCTKVGEEMGVAVQVDPKALDRLSKYTWPGNVRQLENEIRRGAALGGGTLGPKDLSPELNGK